VSAAPRAAHFGLSRTPFGKSIPARDLFPRQAHAEAIARISFCVVESALGVVTGDVGAGKTVALRAAVAGLDPTRHQVIRAQASLWAAWRWSMPGARSRPNGMRVNP